MNQIVVQGVLSYQFLLKRDKLAQRICHEGEKHNAGIKFTGSGIDSVRE